MLARVMGRACLVGWAYPHMRGSQNQTVTGRSTVFHYDVPMHAALLTIAAIPTIVGLWWFIFRSWSNF